MMLSVFIMLFTVLSQYQSWGRAAPDESSDLFDLDPESISKESLDPNVYLNSVSLLQSESDTSLFENPGQNNDLIAFDDSSLSAGVDENCPVNNGQLRKRNGMICPAPGSLEAPSFGIFGDHNEEELDTLEELDSDKRDKNICSEILFFFGRIFDVCCNGGYGPFVIDPDVRLIYSWISDCRLGMSNSYSVALICGWTHGVITAWFAGQYIPCPTQINACCRYFVVSSCSEHPSFHPLCSESIRNEAIFFLIQAKRYVLMVAIFSREWK